MVECGNDDLKFIVDLSLSELTSVVGNECQSKKNGTYRVIMGEIELEELEDSKGWYLPGAELLFGLTDYGQANAEPTYCKELAALTTREVEISTDYYPLSIDEMISILRFENGVLCVN